MREGGEREGGRRRREHEGGREGEREGEREREGGRKGGGEREFSRGCVPLSLSKMYTKHKCSLQPSRMNKFVSGER